MATLAYMPFYPADYLGSPSVEALSLEAQGAYVRLLSRMWLARGGTGRLPDDDRMLADLVGVRIDVWRRLRLELVTVIRFEGGEAFNDRQQMEIVKAQAKYAHRVATRGAKKGPKPVDTAETSPKHRVNIAETSDFSGPVLNDSKALGPRELELELEPKKIRTTTRRVAPTVREYSLRFTAWWNLYPFKRGKKAEAADLWDEWDAGGFADQLDRAVKGYAAAVAHRRTESRYVMNAQTFLARKGQPWVDFVDWQPPNEPKPGRPVIVDEDYRASRALAGLDPPPEPSPPETGVYRLPPAEKSEYARRA